MGVSLLINMDRLLVPFFCWMMHLSALFLKSPWYLVGLCTNIFLFLMSLCFLLEFFGFGGVASSNWKKVSGDV